MTLVQHQFSSYKSCQEKNLSYLSYFQPSMIKSVRMCVLVSINPPTHNPQMDCPPYPYSLVDETTFNIPRMKFQGKVPGELAEMGNILVAEGMNGIMNWEINFKNH